MAKGRGDARTTVARFAGAAAMVATVATSASLAVALLAGCGAGGRASSGVEGDGEAVQAHDLVFEDAEVACSVHDGVLESHYATFELTATVRNDTDRELFAKSMPILSSSGLEPTTFGCDMEPDALVAGASGTVSFEGMFDLHHDVVPVLGFSSPLSFTGLEDAQAVLNADLAAIVGSCAHVEEDGQGDDGAREAARQDGALAMRGCVGATAREGLEEARAAGYSPVFKDSHGVDVTARVRDPEDVTGVGEATIVEVDVSHGLILDSVSFALDYTDPDAALERERAQAKAEAEARAKAEAEAAGAVAEKATDDVAITVEDNDDFARLLAVGEATDPLVARFANAYGGRTIDFDARIVGVTPRGTGRVDLVLVAQPAEGTSARAFAGPTFALKGVGLEALGLAPGDAVGLGTTARVTARIVGFDDETSRIALSPVEVAPAAAPA